MVHPLTGEELRAGKRDVAGVYYLLTDPELGMCHPHSSKPVHECKSLNDFYNVLNSIIKNWSVSDQLIFYYSGHGDIIEGEFCFRFCEEPLVFKNLMLDLKVRKIKKAILIIDACHAGAAIGIKGEGQIFESAEELGIPKGIAIITSSQASEESYEIESGAAGVFTQLFCKGIANGLDRPTEDGLITVDDMVEYINTHLEMDESYKKYPQRSIYSVHGADRKIWISRNKRVSKEKEVPFLAEQPVKSLGELQVLYDQTIPTKRPCLDARIDDLNWELVEELCRAVNPDLIRENSKEKVLEDLKLFSVIRHNGKQFLHKSAVLCFCRRPFMFYPQARATFVSSKTSDGKFVTKDIKGPLIEQFTRLVEETMGHLDKISFISKDGLRRETDEIDRDVVRELISNAVIHRNYEMSGTVQVKITSEAIEVQNPGSFPANMSWDILMKREHTSKPLDPTIALYLGNLSAKPFEGIGRGFEVFKKYIKENGVDSITCEELPGPAVRIQVRRRTAEDLKKVVMPPWRLFKSFLKYTAETFSALAIFAIFVATSILGDRLSRSVGEFGIVLKIVNWIISVLGGLSCIALVVRNTIVFIKFLFKGPPQETSAEKPYLKGFTK